MFQIIKEFQVKEIYGNDFLKQKIKYYKNNTEEIYYHKNGQISLKMNYVNNKYHNENGPAIIFYDENGNIEEELYYLDNKQLTKKTYNRNIEHYIELNNIKKVNQSDIENKN